MSFLLISPEQHFSEVLKEACQQRKVKAPPLIETYIIHLLKYYLNTKNLYQNLDSEQSKSVPDTLAEMYLIAMNSEPPKNKEIMKGLADRALYVSGFFGDSLQRKTVDIDYYSNIGSAAYSNLATWSKDDTVASVYKTFSKSFLAYVDVLSYISEKSRIQSDQNVLRLYEKYIKTGSDLARDRLNELGVMPLPKDQLKIKKA